MNDENTIKNMVFLEGLMGNTKITFELDDDQVKRVTKLANDMFDGNFSMALRYIIKNWK